MTQSEFYNKKENQKETTQLSEFYNVDGTPRNNNIIEFNDLNKLNDFLRKRNKKNKVR